MGLKIIDTKKSIKVNSTEYKYGQLLLYFIYTDYPALLKYYYSKYSTKETLYLPLLDYFSKYSNKETFFNNSTFEDERFKKDPFFQLMLFEVYKIYNNSDASVTFEDIINEVSNKIFNLQDLYYEALNICFNKSHKLLGNYSINARLDYYSNLPIGINALTHLTNSTSYSENYILIDNISDLNKNLFNSEKNYFDDDLSTYPPSTEVESRLDIISYNNSELHHTKNKSYSLPNNEVLSKLIDKTYTEKQLVKVINLNSLLDLCSFEFFKLLENKDTFIIQECKLCKKLFIKPSTSKKEYCDNILTSDNKAFNKPCSAKNVGNKIISELNTKTNNSLKLYEKIYKRLDMRATRNSSSKKELEVLNILKKSKTAFKDKQISLSEFNYLLEEFNTLKPLSFNINTLSDKMKSIIDKFYKN